MAELPAPAGGWNIFARELEKALRAHNKTIHDLTSLAAIHPQKVKRLLQSLVSCTHMSVLSPDDLESVYWTASFTDLEKQQIQAAIIVTAIEEKLMNRIDPYNAWLAADQIYPIIFNAVQQYAMQATGGITEVRHTTEEGLQMLETAITYIDRATIALHMSRGVQSAMERSEQARLARSYFDDALQELADFPAAIRATEDWQMWQAEAQRGMTAATKILVDIGETDG